MNCSNFTEKEYSFFFFFLFVTTLKCCPFNWLLIDWIQTVCPPYSSFILLLFILFKIEAGVSLFKQFAVVGSIADQNRA